MERTGSAVAYEREESRVTSRLWPDSNDGLAIDYNGGKAVGQTGLGGR